MGGRNYKVEEEKRWEERKIDEGGRKRRKRSIDSVWPACECGEEERGKILSERASPENQTPKEEKEEGKFVTYGRTPFSWPLLSSLLQREEIGKGVVIGRGRKSYERHSSLSSSSSPADIPTLSAALRARAESGRTGGRRKFRRKPEKNCRNSFLLRRSSHTQSSEI